MRRLWAWGLGAALLSLLLHWYAQAGIADAYRTGHRAMLGRLDLYEELSGWMVALLIGAMPVALLTGALGRGRRQRRN